MAFWWGLCVVLCQVLYVVYPGTSSEIVSGNVFGILMGTVCGVL